MTERVAAIGLGHMGAALAASLLKAGNTVTVWNRTRSKSEALRAEGALVAADAFEAIDASDMIVVCVGSYADATAILDDCPPLTGKTLIQLTTGTVADAVAMERWAQQKGGLYLDGVILAYPSGIGGADTVIATAGAEDAWQTSERVVRSLGGASLFLGSNLAAPIALEASATAPMLMSLMGVIRGAHIMEQAGQDLHAYADLVGTFGPLFAETMRKQVLAIAHDDYGETEASLGTWAAALNHNPDAFGEDGALDLLAPIRKVLNEAVAAGYGDEDLAAAIRIIRRQDASST